MEPTPDYQSSLTHDFRKQHGVFYTSPALIEFILNRALEPRLLACGNLSELLSLKVCDPSCGTGGFLLAAYERFKKHAARLGVMSAEVSCSIQKACLFGVDLDSNAVLLAKSHLSSANIFCANALLDRDLLKNDFFDVVIGNPPYGAKMTSADRARCMREFGVQDRDSASFFMCLAFEVAKPGGTTGFIVPKSFIYSSSFADVKARLASEITDLVDCGMAWKNVKLEQAIYLHEKKTVTSAYVSWRRNNSANEENIQRVGSVLKADAALFGGLLPALNADEIKLGKLLRTSKLFVADVVHNSRGARLQQMAQEKDPTDDVEALDVIGGRHLASYRWTNVPRATLTRSHIADQKAFAQPESILVQNIVSHLKNPTPHLKITAQLVNQKTSPSIALLDTVNQLRCMNGYSPRVLLAVLNSKLMSWYVYRFVVGQAVRTIHFDAPLISRIPVPGASQTHDLEALVDQMLREPSAVLEQRIERLVWKLFDLGEGGTARTVGV